jgi:hypothetical protein
MNLDRRIGSIGVRIGKIWALQFDLWINYKNKGEGTYS